MKPYRTIAALAFAAWCSSSPSAAETFAFTNINRLVPDGRPAGVLDVQSIATSQIQITDIQVGLNISGEFNGDLYAYLQHGGYTSILLNRPGRTAANPDGYADSGFRITLSDAAPADIHLYENTHTPPPDSPLTGLWQPDGRLVDPATVVDLSPRTAGLAGFNGLNPNGDWKLFIADMSLGGTNMVNGWQLEIVPEPSSAAFFLLAGVLAFAIRSSSSAHDRYLAADFMHRTD